MPAFNCEEELITDFSENKNYRGYGPLPRACVKTRLLSGSGRGSSDTPKQQDVREREREREKQTGERLRETGKDRDMEEDAEKEEEILSRIDEIGAEFVRLILGDLTCRGAMGPWDDHQESAQTGPPPSQVGIYHRYPPTRIRSTSSSFPCRRNVYHREYPTTAIGGGSDGGLC